MRGEGASFVGRRPRAAEVMARDLRRAGDDAARAAELLRRPGLTADERRGLLQLKAERELALADMAAIARRLARG